MAEKHIEVGDKVQWNYGAGHPQGVAAEIKTQPGEKVQIESKKGNTVSRNADETNPAVRVERQGDGNNQDVVKRMSELTKVGEGKEKEGGEKEPVVGEKREREVVERQDEEAEGAEKAGADKSGETGVEKAVGEGKNKKRGAKKAKVDEQGKATTKEKEAADTKSSRGRGRGRGKTATAQAGSRRTSGRAKKGSTEPQGKSTSVLSGEGEKVEGATGKVDEVVMSEAIPEVDGENEEGAKVKAGEAPSGHTRSEDVQAPACN